MKLFIGALLLFSVSADMSPVVVTPKDSDWAVLSTSGDSKLYQVSTDGMDYKLGPPYVLELRGNRTTVGFDAGFLLGEKSSESYTEFMLWKFGAKYKLVESIMDGVWNTTLAHYVPKDMLEEFDAISRGAWAAGLNKTVSVGQQQKRMVTLATLPADLVNIVRLVESDYEQGMPESLKEKINKALKAMEEKSGIPPGNIPYPNGTFPKPTARGALPLSQTRPGFCDFLAVWGKRTEDGRLISTRNLDWGKQSGLAKYKLITVWNIEGKTPYATIGFAGALTASIAGMSKAGITVSEANLDNANVTFRGFPWPLRLRHIMEEATDLASARKVWASANNTAAFNFLIGSASDAPKGPAAMAMETMKDFTAYFYDNSPIEKEAKWENSVIGKPMPDAVWRSNHALHPTVMSTQENLWNDTIWRYMELHNLIEEKSTGGKAMTAEDVVYIVSVLGIKGTNYLTCDQDFAEGDNIMSIVYDPSKHNAIVSWEDGMTDQDWRPAACNKYILFDLSRVF